MFLVLMIPATHAWRGHIWNLPNRTARLATNSVRCLPAMRTSFVLPALDAQLGQGTRQ
jgi:hypothetical protein